MPDPEAQSSPTVTEIRHVAAAGVSRVYSMPSEDAPKSYLDEAVMRAVPREQALETWAYWWSKGLPEGGVEKLYPWLLQRAKGRTNAAARAGPLPKDAIKAVPKGIPAAEALKNFR